MPGAARKNFLVIVADQHRYEIAPGYPGFERVMPNVARLASRGVTFLRAYTPSPLCAPARASLATGTAYGRSGVWNNCGIFTGDLPTYYQHLRRAGYFVAGAGKFDLHKGGDCWGIAGQCGLTEWGLDAGLDCEGKHDATRTGTDVPRGPYMHFLHQLGLAHGYADDMAARDPYQTLDPSPLPDSAYVDNWICGHAKSLLEQTPPQHPWCLTVNFAGPHEPLDPTQRMLDLAGDLEVPLPAGVPSSAEKPWRNYLALLRNIDVQIGSLLELVSERGEADRTVVVYTSDHGEMFGEHGVWGKGTHHEASVRVPLVLYDPTIDPSASTYNRPVNLQDVAATVLDLAGCDPLPTSESTSLRGALDGSPVARDVATSGLTVDTAELAGLAAAYYNGDVERASRQLLKAWRLATDGRFKFVRWDDGRTALFDMATDPTEATDVANTVEADDVARAALLRLRGRLEETFGVPPTPVGG